MIPLIVRIKWQIENVEIRDEVALDADDILQFDHSLLEMKCTGTEMIATRSIAQTVVYDKRIKIIP